MSTLADRRALARARQVAVPDELPDHRWPLASPLAGTPVAVVDVETTGIDPAEARIVEIAVVHTTIGSHEAEVVLSQRVNPGIPIPEATTKVHGITDADVANAQPWTMVWEDVQRVCANRILAAYNAPYDHGVLHAEWKRHGLGARWSGWEPAWLDPLVLVKGIDKFEKGKKLRDAARRRGISLDAHGAAGDAMTTALLLSALLEEAAHGIPDRNGRIRFRSPVEPTVEAYLRWQRQTALDQERDFVAYMTQNGTRDIIECPWHRLEGVEPPRAAKPVEPKPTATCSSCGEPLVWTITKDGRKMPCDPKMITATHTDVPGGKLLTLVFENGDVSRVYEAPRDWVGPTVLGRIAHWATCRFAASHRKTA